jgi:hypothetical protein
MPIKADQQALHASEYHDVIIYSCQLRMLGQMTMLRGHQVLKNACVQLKLGVGTDGPSTIDHKNDNGTITM